MTQGQLAAVEFGAPDDLAVLLVGPDLLLEVEVVGVGEEADFEVEGVAEVGPGDVDVSAGVWVCGVVSYGDVLACWDGTGIAEEAGVG